MRNHLIDGVEVPFTPEEEAAQDIIDAAHTATILPNAISNKQAAVDALHLSKNTANFTSGGNVYDASAASQLNIAHAISYGELNSISGATTRSWTLADNSTVTVTWTALRTMATAVFERSDTNHANCRAHKDAIDVLSTVAAVNSYDFSTGWT